jgi:hypothetical protein
VSCQRDTIARPRVDLDYLMLKFVFDVEDESRKIGVVLEIVDDPPFDSRSQCLQDVGQQIVGERSLLRSARYRHRDGRPNSGIDAWPGRGGPDVECG